MCVCVCRARAYFCRHHFWETKFYRCKRLVFVSRLNLIQMQPQSNSIRFRLSFFFSLLIFSAVNLIQGVHRALGCLDTIYDIATCLNNAICGDSLFRQTRRTTKRECDKVRKRMNNKKEKLMPFTTAWPIYRNKTAYSQFQSRRVCFGWLVCWLYIIVVALFRRHNGMHLNF